MNIKTNLNNFENSYENIPDDAKCILKTEDKSKTIDKLIYISLREATLKTYYINIYWWGYGPC